MHAGFLQEVERGCREGARVQSNTLLPPLLHPLPPIYTQASRCLYVKGGCFVNPRCRGGGGNTQLAICLCRFSFEGCTLSRCVATLSEHPLLSFCLAPSPSVHPSVSLALSLSLSRSISLCSHARQLTFRCRNRTFLHERETISYVISFPRRSVCDLRSEMRTRVRLERFL